jgi:hypothetical protein
MKEPIVTLEVIAVFAQAKEVPITVRIGRAEPQGDGWGCPVEIAPIYAQPMAVRGVDSFHATWLACSLVLKLLGQLKKEGAALRGADGGEFPVDAYLAGLGSDASGG